MRNLFFGGARRVFNCYFLRHVKLILFMNFLLFKNTVNIFIFYSEIIFRFPSIDEYYQKFYYRGVRSFTSHY